MQLVRLLRHCIQAVALAIFAYQMIVAVDKYTTFSSVPTETTKDIADAKLPDIYICSKKLNFLRLYGYIPNNIEGFLRGTLKHSSFITWEGKNNLSYDEITSKKYS